jgi:hypothetical protein
MELNKELEIYTGYKTSVDVHNEGLFVNIDRSLRVISTVDMNEEIY